MLVAVSSPWAGEKCFAVVCDLATRLRSHVIVVHVAQATEQDDSNESVRQRGEQALASVTERLKEAKIPVESMLLFGDDVAQAIVNAAVDQNASLIMLGASGRGTIARLLSGDVPGQVARKSTVPVLLFPPTWSGTI